MTRFLRHRAWRSGFSKQASDKLSGCFYDTQFDSASESYDTALIISNFIDVPRSHINEPPSDQKVFISKTIERITKFNTTVPMFQQDRLIMRRSFVDNRLQSVQRIQEVECASRHGRASIWRR